MAATDLTVKKSVSLPRELLAAALQRAQAQHRTFSNYLQLLIARDIERSRPKK